MATRRFILVLLAPLAAALAACRTPGPEDRIRENPVLFASLPPDVQAQVRQGHVNVGFPAEAVRLALGEPDRIYERRTAAGATEVWSYTGAFTRPRSQIVFVQVPTRGGWVTGSETVWVNDVHEYERLRIEFESGRVRALERLRRRDTGELEEDASPDAGGGPRRVSAAGALENESAPAEGGAPPRQALESLAGRIVRKPWTKSLESWNAGGSDYFVLDVGDASVKDRSAKEGVILRPSQRVPLDRFAALVGRRVRVSGEYVAGKPEPPPPADGDGALEQRPSLPEGEPPRRGSGFRVEAVDVAD